MSGGSSSAVDPSRVNVRWLGIKHLGEVDNLRLGHSVVSVLKLVAGVRYSVYRSVIGRTQSSSQSIEVPTLFHAVVARSDHLLDYLRGTIDVAAEFLGHVPANLNAGVRAVVISELQWSHRVVISQIHRCIDVLGGGDPLLNHPGSLHAEHQAQPRYREAGKVVDDDVLAA